MNKPNPQDRREHPRLLKNIPLKISGTDFDIVSETKNLSRSGAYCRVSKYLEPMTKLKIHLLHRLPTKNKNATNSPKGSPDRVKNKLADQIEAEKNPSPAAQQSIADPSQLQSLP